MMASFTLRRMDFSGLNHRFFANCWVMVLPPAASRPFFRLRSSASRMVLKLNPLCFQNVSSSEMTTALRRWGEMRLSGTHVWRGAGGWGFFPCSVCLASCCSRRYSIMEVNGGLMKASLLTGGQNR